MRLGLTGHARARTTVVVTALATFCATLLAGQPHLDATWVARQRANGWRLLPLWVGPQAACQT